MIDGTKMFTSFVTLNQELPTHRLIQFMETNPRIESVINIDLVNGRETIERFIWTSDLFDFFRQISAERWINHGPAMGHIEGLEQLTKIATIND